MQRNCSVTLAKRLFKQGTVTSDGYQAAGPRIIDTVTQSTCVFFTIQFKIHGYIALDSHLQSTVHDCVIAKVVNISHW